MKTVIVQRSRIVDLKDHFEDVSRVTPREGESMKKVQTFKWRCGRNHQKCEALCKEFQKAIHAMMAPSPELIEFFKKQTELMQSFQLSDAKGNPMTNPDGSIILDTSRSDEIDNAIADLKVRHPEAIAFHEKREAESEAFMDGEIEVEFFAVKMDEIPDNIGGVWLPEIVEMIVDPPADEG